MRRAGCKDGYIRQIAIFFMYMVNICVVTAPYVIEFNHPDFITLKGHNRILPLRIDVDMTERETLKLFQPIELFLVIGYYKITCEWTHLTLNVYKKLKSGHPGRIFNRGK